MTPRSIDAGVGIGEIFLEKYRVDSILGYGGMGVVAMCTHLALNERVAIKMLRRDVLDDADAVERFMREAQAASKLRSEYVARVTDVGRSGNNVPYMVMEYLEGHDLGQLLDERGSLALPWAVELTLQACEALAEAHSIGIVHRDVKPSNLFVTWRPDGSALIKVLDFGISKAPTGSTMQLTQTQSLLGTPAYMSPEQMRSARMVDARTDIWSLGTVLYELLEGRRPFEAESFSEMCVKVAVDPPGEMTSTPLQLQQVVLRCLEKTPEQRYASMAELGRDLVPFSNDPHQAQVLVERMSRMLRRSQLVDWDPVRTGVPAPIREVWSTEGKADAATATTPAIPTPRPSPSSAPAQSASTTYNVPRRSRWGMIIGGAAIAGAATIGVALSLAHDSPSAPAVLHPIPTPPGPADPVPGPGSANLLGSAAPAVIPAPPPGQPGDAGVDQGPRVRRDPMPPPRQPNRTEHPAIGGGKAVRPPRDSPRRDPDPRAAHDAKPPCDPFADSHIPNACPPQQNVHREN